MVSRFIGKKNSEKKDLGPGQDLELANKMHRLGLPKDLKRIPGMVVHLVREDRDLAPSTAILILENWQTKISLFAAL